MLYSIKISIAIENQLIWDAKKHQTKESHMKPDTGKEPIEKLAVSAETAGKAASPAVLTVEEWAEKMRISRGKAYSAVKSGQVRCIRIGRLIRIPAA